MAKKKKHQSSPFTTPADLKLTVEDIDTVEEYRHLTPEQKEELIDFVFEISNALYHICAKESFHSEEDEPQKA